MAITHADSIRNTLCDTVVDAVDDGSTDSQGDLVILEGSTELVEIELEDPAFGDASGGTADLNGSPQGTVTADGDADTFEFRDKDNDLVFDGEVAESGSDLNISSTSLSVDDKVEISSFSYSAPN